MQGYNAQAVCNENQIVVAAELNADSPDFGHLEPMVCAAEGELARAGVAEAPAVVVADAGYWHHDQMDALSRRGIRVLILVVVLIAAGVVGASRRWEKSTVARAAVGGC
jgi:hypothetical protein